MRFVGEVAGTTGTWLGVEWDDSARGKHDGCHKGVRYFTCNMAYRPRLSFRLTDHTGHRQIKVPHRCILCPAFAPC